MMHQEHRLENGLKILMIPAPGFQSVSAGIFVGVGSRYEDPTEAGTAHFIEHMLFKGTKHRPTAKLIAEAIEGIGGVSNAYTDQETTVYYAKVGASQAKTAINVLADLVRYPNFDPDEIEKERQIIGEEINMLYDSPESWVNALVDQVIWPEHPLGQDVVGTHQSLAAMNRASVISFYQKSYHPENMLVAIGGVFEPEMIVAEITDVLGDWQPISPPVFRPAPEAQAEPHWYVEDRPIGQGHLCLALPGLPRAHPDRYALSMLNTILGDGMSSRLFLKIREEKGWAYAVDSSLTMLQDTGAMVIYAGVDPQRAPDALQTILNELSCLRDEPVQEAELQKAREYVKGRLVLGLEDSFSRAAWVAYQTLFTGTVKSLEEVLLACDTVTVAEVQEIAQKIIKPAMYSLAAVGPFGRGEMLGELIVG